MGGLVDSLSMAARSLQAQQYAMDVTGQNISNVNTPGYSRRVVDFAAVPPDAGGGVEIERVRSVRDTLLERRLLQQVPLSARDSAIAEALGVVETALGKSGESLDARLDTFFSAFADLSASPTSSVARREVQAAGESLSAAFAEMADRLESARRDADAHVKGAVEEINSLAERVARLNAAIPSARLNGSAQTLEDEQSQLVRQLAELVDVHVIPRQEGGVDLTIGNGRPLVAAANAYALEALPTLPGGSVALSSQGVTVTSELTGGSIGGLLHVRDTAIPSYLSSLDTLAFETASQVNTIHSAGFDLNGNAGGNFFSFSTPPVGVSGAARALRVDPAITADNSTIAAASVAVVGDNGAARAIAGLRSTRVLNGNTATLLDGWSNLVYQVGSDSRNAANDRDSHREIVREVEALRDQVSGVSLDEEAMNLLKFQRAYEANAKFFTAVDRMLSTLLDALGR